MHHKTVEALFNARRVLAMIQTFQREHGCTPAMLEISKATGLAPSVVWHALNTLQRDYGYVRREKRLSRTLRVTRRAL